MRKVSAKSAQWLEKELPILESEGVLTRDVAKDVRAYYRENTASGFHWAVVAFSILGSLLIGAGIILLFARNWEDLGRPTRAVLSFCPIVIGAILSATALLRNGGVAFRESAGVFHSLAVGASIALIGQTYHLPSDAPAFLLTWALLILPLQFLLSSTGSFIAYLALICGWCGAAQYEYGQAAGFWLLLLPAVGRLWGMVKVNRDAPDTLLSVFGVLFAVTLATGVVFERTLPGLWIVAYSALLSAAGLIGARIYGDRDGWNNPPKMFGVIGIAALAYVFTWSEMWNDIGWNNTRNGWNYKAWGVGADVGVTLVFLAGWGFTAMKTFRSDSIETITLAMFPIIATLCFFIGSSGGNQTNTLTAVIFNGFMLFYGVMFIVLGCRDKKSRRLNGGMAVVSLLLITRFFDEDFGFLARGVVFIALGVCFLTANLIMARGKKALEGTS